MSDLEKEITLLEAKLGELKRRQKIVLDAKILDAVNSHKEPNEHLNKMIQDTQNLKIVSIRCPAFSRSKKACNVVVEVQFVDMFDTQLKFLLNGNIEKPAELKSCIRGESPLFCRHSERTLPAALMCDRIINLLVVYVKTAGTGKSGDTGSVGELTRLNKVLETYRKEK